MTTAPSSLVSWTTFVDHLTKSLYSSRGAAFLLTELVFKNKSQTLLGTSLGTSFCDIRFTLTDNVTTVAITLIRSPRSIRSIVYVDGTERQGLTYEGQTCEAIMRVIENGIYAEKTMTSSHVGDVTAAIQRAIHGR